MFEVKTEIISKLTKEWDSIVCSACGSVKWEKYPFCRSCSIRLQRINLMLPLKPFRGHYGKEIADHPYACQKWARAYDRARDYLLASKVVLSHSEDD